MVPVLRVGVLPYIAVQQSTAGTSTGTDVVVAGVATVLASRPPFSFISAARFCRASRKILEMGSLLTVCGGGGGGTRLATTRQTVCRRAVVSAWPRAGSRRHES